MAKLTVPILALALGAAASVALVSCGGSDEGLLPGETASEIVANLDSVEQLAASGDCSSASSAAATVHAQIDSLGSDVDPQLREALVKGAARLESVTADPASCVETTTETTTTTTEPTTTEETETETTDTETTDTETTPTETTAPTTTTTPTTPTEPPTGGTPGSGGTGAPKRVK